MHGQNFIGTTSIAAPGPDFGVHNDVTGNAHPSYTSAYTLIFEKILSLSHALTIVHIVAGQSSATCPSHFSKVWNELVKSSS